MARIFLDEMRGINQGGILASYGLPGSPFSTEEYITPIQVVQEQPVRTTKKKSSKSKPRKKSNNDGIIRNHDSVWDYKIENGKLLTRRKTSDGKWYDITNNDEARGRIESFTGRSIGAKLSNNSQSQSSKATSTVQTKQTAKPATTQSTRQQVARQDDIKQQTTPQRPVARQDSTRRDTTVTQQPRSLATTRGSNTGPNWQNMTEDEVDAWFNNNSYSLPEVTVTSKRNSDKKGNQLLSAEDLVANGWHWSNGNNFGDKPTENQALLVSAHNKAYAGDNILLDSNGAVVPTSEVNRYINRGRIPLYISDYDARFYQPQSENSTLKDVRKAQDIRRNREFDRQRNSALATMFSLPAFGISMASAPAATLLALGGSELVGAGFEGAYKHATGKSWEEALGGSDPNAQFYANMIQPGRLIGGMLGAGVASATAPARQAIGRAVSNGVNNIVGNGEMPTLIGLMRQQSYVNKPVNVIGNKFRSLKQGFDRFGDWLWNEEGTVAPPNKLAKWLDKKAEQAVIKEERKSLSTAKAATKAYWEERQPYQVKVKKDATGRLYPTFNTKKVNNIFKGYPSYYDVDRLNMNANSLETILSHYADLSRFGRNGETRYLIENLKGDINQLYGLPYGYWQSVRPAPGYLEGPRYGGGIIIGQ